MEQISNLAAMNNGFDECRMALKEEFDLRRGDKKREVVMEDGKDTLY